MLHKEMQVSNPFMIASNKGTTGFVSVMSTSCFIVSFPIPSASVFSTDVISAVAFNRFQCLDPGNNLFKTKALNYILSNKKMLATNSN